jgi:hypothetical protein
MRFFTTIPVFLFSALLAVGTYDQCLISFRKWVRVTAFCPRVVGYQGQHIPRVGVVEQTVKKLNYWIEQGLNVKCRVVNPVTTELKPGYNISVSDYFYALRRVHNIHVDRLDECITLENADQRPTLHLLLQGIVCLFV